MAREKIAKGNVRGRGGNRGAGTSVTLTATQLESLQKLEEMEEKKEKKKQKNVVKKQIMHQLHKHGILEEESSDSSESDSSSSDSAKQKKKKKARTAKKKTQKKVRALHDECEQLKKQNEALSKENEGLQLKQKEYDALDEEIWDKCQNSNVTLTLAQYDELVGKAKAKSDPPTPAKQFGIFAKFYAPATASQNESVVALAKLFNDKCRLANECQPLAEGVKVTTEIENELIQWAKAIVKHYQISSTPDVAELKAVLTKWLPTNTASKAETMVKALLRVVCSRKIPITEKELGMQLGWLCIGGGNGTGKCKGNSSLWPPRKTARQCLYKGYISPLYLEPHPGNTTYLKNSLD